eukprot:CAMPEP_0114150602 /NCGR_PEP_ID=MMETSP0043_2-20121206/22799_1 /TAXON_ID=464988 /ORGANISM="Hemiselmis andersenii, Strain CCMP644" /LENGTH=45 /DNA_ID= /DNA_START= /DNA_END= /DNA_ORIENTATION=
MTCFESNAFQCAFSEREAFQGKPLQITAANMAEQSAGGGRERGRG